MAKEFFIDGIGNISIQGPVVTLSMIRSTQGNVQALLNLHYLSIESNALHNQTRPEHHST